MRPGCVSHAAARKRKPQRSGLTMNNNELIKRRRRINVREFAAKLLCHPDTIKRRIKKPPPQFPMPAFLMGKYTWFEDEADAYVEYLTAASRESRRRILAGERGEG